MAGLPTETWKDRAGTVPPNAKTAVLPIRRLRRAAMILILEAASTPPPQVLLRGGAVGVELGDRREYRRRRAKREIKRLNVCAVPQERACRPSLEDCFRGGIFGQTPATRTQQQRIEMFHRMIAFNLHICNSTESSNRGARVGNLTTCQCGGQAHENIHGCCAARARGPASLHVGWE